MNSRRDAKNNRSGSRSREALLTADESAELSAHVAHLARSGLPLSEGLRALAAEHVSHRLGRLLRSIAEQLDRGTTIEEALHSHGDRFPPHMRGLLLAGIRTSRLAEVLERYVNNRRTAVQRRRQAWLSLAYPTLLLLLTLALLMFSNFFIVPETVNLYSDFELEMPEIFMVRVWLSREATPYFAASLACLLAAFGALRIMEGRGAWLRIIVRIPLIGPIWRWSSLAELSHLLGLLIDQRVPMPEALVLTADGIDDTELAAACRELSTKVDAGVSFGDAVAEEKRFPGTVVPLVRWGEQSDALPEALQATAAMFEGRVDIQLSLVRVVVPPLVFLVVIAAAIFMVTTWYAQTLALIKLVGDLS